MSEEPLANKNPAEPASDDAEYDLIFATVSETAQGRRFLEEYARRIGPSGLTSSLAAIERIQTAFQTQSADDHTDLLLEMAEMAQAILHLRAEIGVMQMPGTVPLETTEELDSIVKATELATSSILASAETVQEVAWTLREGGANSALCDLLDAQATEIYTTCSFQDLTGQRTRKVIQVLRYLEDRINASVSSRQKKPEAASLLQAEIDAVLQGERQDATLEDISRAMASMEPAIDPQPVESEAEPAEVPQDVRPELSVADTILAETETAQEWTVKPSDPPKTPEDTPPTDGVAEDPKEPKSEWEPAWVILHRLQAEEHKKLAAVEAQAEPQPEHHRSLEPDESGLFVAEAMSQLAQSLRPSPLLPPPELDFKIGRKPADPLTELQTTMAAAEMNLLPPHDDDIIAPAPEQDAQPVPEADTDDFLFEPEAAKPDAAPPQAAMPEKPEVEAVPAPAPVTPAQAAASSDARSYDPLAPLRALSDAQKIALFS